VGDGGDAALSQCYSRVLSPSGQAVAAEDARVLERAFDTLPEHYREVISLSRIARMSRAEVAIQMRRTEDSVRNLLSRALAALAEALRATLADEGR
jgi:RNA polymerase sigma factor (sigma-70 family)